MAAVLFDLQSTVSNNLMSTCTSGKCEWKRRCGNNEYAIPFQDLKIVKAEFGKTKKDPLKPVNFEPGHSSFDASIMKDMLRRGLQEVLLQAVGLQFLPRPREPEIPESLVAKHIADDSNVERYESVENITLYTLKEYADIFKSENNVGSEELCSDETVQTFMDFLSIDEKQCDIICAKTVQIVSSGLIKDLDE